MDSLQYNKFFLVCLVVISSFCKPTKSGGGISPVAIALLGGGVGSSSSSSSQTFTYKISSADLAVEVGGSINLEITGTGSSSYPAYEFVYFSSDNTISSNTDSYVSMVTVQGTSGTQTFTIDIPCGTPTGMQYIGFSSGQYYNQLINVTDNGGCSPVVASVQTLTATTAIQGTSYTFPVSITSGAQLANYTVYLSTDTTIDGSDRSITTVNLNSSSTSVTITIPGTVTGTYYVGLYYSGTQRSASPNQLTITVPPPINVNVSGTVQYQFVPVNSATSTLNTSGIFNKPARYITVQLYDNTSTLISSTVSSNTGAYSFSNAAVNGGGFKIRMISEMKDAGGKYEFHIKNAVPGTTVGSDYAIDSSTQTASSCTSSCTVNLTAMDSNRGNGPFSILDVIRKGIDKVWSADSSTVFPAMNVKWQNGSNSGSYFTQDSATCGTGISNCIVLLGNRSQDSDEFDLGVIAHEFTHYLEASLSRSDSIGGSHTTNDLLEPRIAYGEGLGNAMGAIINDDPLYVDTSSGGGFRINMENKSHTLSGYYAETSVQSIIWDLYDSVSDTRNSKTDNLSYSFADIWNAVIALKTTDNITYLHEFIKALKAAKPSDVTEINNILGMESVAADEATENSVSISSTFSGSGIPSHICMGSLSTYAYAPVIQTVGTTSGAAAYPTTTHRASQWCGAISQYSNKLFGSQFFKVTPSNNGTMTVTATRTGSGASLEDPDVYITSRGVDIKTCNQNYDEVCSTSVSSSNVYIVEIRTYSACMAGDVNCVPSSSGFNEYTVKIDLP